MYKYLSTNDSHNKTKLLLFLNFKASLPYRLFNESNLIKIIFHENITPLFILKCSIVLLQIAELTVGLKL